MFQKFHLILLCLVAVTSVHAKTPRERQSIEQKILDQGVPGGALKRMTEFLFENQGRQFQQELYICEGQNPESVKPCHENKRTATTATVTLGSPENVVIIDYSAPSTDRRFFQINLVTGNVIKYYVAHGIGSGKSNYATKFSNTKDSRQTSLGFYLTGDTYSGSYGKTLRMYGLEPSNDQAYNRDIVLHGAWYVGKDFIRSRDPSTGEPRGRLGVSWGCPAVSVPISKKVIPILKSGSVILHYHPDFM